MISDELEVVEAETIEEETVDAVPVLVDVRPLQRTPANVIPAFQAAAAAATGFVAGAATFALVRRRATRKLARTVAGPPRRSVDWLPVMGTRTYIVDVHVIGRPRD